MLLDKKGLLGESLQATASTTDSFSADMLARSMHSVRVIGPPRSLDQVAEASPRSPAFTRYIPPD